MKPRKFYISLVDLVVKETPILYLKKDGSFYESSKNLASYDLYNHKFMEFDTPNDAMEYLEEKYSYLLESKRVVILRQNLFDDINFSY